MNELPEFFRTEVYHPLFVHFPIVLLLIATLFKIVSLWSKKVTYSEGGSILLILGVISVWIAVYTGDQADGIVSRQLCDPTVLKEHENLATTTAWIFSMALVLDLLLRYVESFRKICLLHRSFANAGRIGNAYTGRPPWRRTGLPAGSRCECSKRRLFRIQLNT